MLTLAIDTSSITESVALLREQQVLAECSLLVTTDHASTLILLIERILTICDAKIEDVDLFALTTGPGSFTGIRIGASTIKGLALATGKPVAGVSTLEALAFNISSTGLDICPLMDARRNEAYMALYRINAAGRPYRLLDERVAKPEVFFGNLTGDILFLGDGVDRYARLIDEALTFKAFFAPPHLQFIRASAVGILALDHYKQGKTLDLLTFIPRYLRLSQAEVRLNGG